MVEGTFGHYAIVEKLGEGGMGVVYRAEDTRLQRSVALKLLGERTLADPAARARLLREARMASSLNHPNVCTVYEVGEAGGHAYIAMELVEGRPLRRMIPAGGLPIEEVLNYGMQIAAALAHSHDRGVVHRDLKSANVIITPDGRVKVLDFGLAKRPDERPPTGDAEQTLAGPLTEAGTIVGTQSYMSPEALRGEPVGPPSDIWAFGVLLFEMATGQLPFQGKSLVDLATSIVRDPVPAMPVAAGAGLTAIVQRCLAKLPGQRYQRGSEVRAALEAIGSGAREVAVAPPPRPRRQRALWLAAAVVVVAAAAAVVWRPWAVPPRHTPLPSKVAEANDYLQRAMFFLGTQQDLPRGRLMLEKALTLDPAFAQARAWYGLTSALMIVSGLSHDTALLYTAEEELRRALQDDPNSARAHASLAMVYLYQGRKELMPQEARRAMELDPSEKDGPLMLAVYHKWSGAYQQSQALLAPLLKNDPLYSPARAIVGENLRQMGDLAGSIREQELALEQDPKNVFALGSLALTYLQQGSAGKAGEILAVVKAAEPANFAVRLISALQLAVAGRREDAVRAMDVDVLKFGELISFASNVAEFYAVLGDKPKALEWLDRAVRAGDERADWFERDPLLAAVHGELRFKQIIDGIRIRREQLAKPDR
jgi:tetratricopeptide (TPR) repeat protein/predicted Ser/Thr protein kinase